MTADDYGPYRKYLLETYGEDVRPAPTVKPGRPRKPYKVAPPELLFASLHKTRAKGKVVEVYPFTLGFLLYDVEFLGEETFQFCFTGIDVAEEGTKGFMELWKGGIILIVQQFLL